MTKTGLICNLIVIAIALIMSATMLASVLRGNNEYRKFKLVMWGILALYSSWGSATLFVYYYASVKKLEVLLFLIIGMTVFGWNLVIADFIESYMARKDGWRLNIENDRRN